MNNRYVNQIKILTAIGLFIAFAMPMDAAEGPRKTLSFDADWRFKIGDAPDAKIPTFKDSGWRALNVPHDWSIEGPFDRNNPTRGSGGFLPAGVGWYRKHFTLPATDANRRVFVEFDGVMANSDVWINGVHLGKRPYGYVSFGYELTSHLQFGNGKTNVLAVRADNSGQPASRWYAGAGIYRHVRLVVTDPVHFEKWGNFVSTPQIFSQNRRQSALVRVESTVVNQSSFPRKVSVLLKIDGATRGTWSMMSNPDAQEVPPGKSVLFKSVYRLSDPQFWSVDDPKLYRAVAIVMSGNTAIDEETIQFGVREFEFDATNGFLLNRGNWGGNSHDIKIKGVCLHHDGGAFGAAVPNAVWERRLRILKELGCNAIRTAHNPPSPDFLDLCDRMGFLVMDEMFDCWVGAKNPHDYHLYFNEWSKIDTADTVRRDRNHPSIFAYSIGNEIRDTPRPEIAKPILAGLVEVCHSNDPSRPVTQGLFRPNVSRDYDNGLADMLDLVGQNYRENEILAAHRQKPTRKIIGTENAHDRRVWLALRDNPPYSGQFLWTGIDYLGEARQWPTIGAASGLLDRTGRVYERGFERQSWWTTPTVVHDFGEIGRQYSRGDKPMVRIVRRNESSRATPADPGFEPLAARFPVVSDWSPKNRELHEEDVEVYSNCETVELFLNGKSLGAKTRPADDSALAWKVPFEPGTLKAVGKTRTWPQVTHELRTAGKPAKISLNADRNRITPDFDDVSHVVVTVTDAAGVPIADASDLITFKITGPGVIAAVDNGDNASHEPFKASQRHAYRGECVAFVQATGSGRITLTASAPGLASDSVSITGASARR